MAYFAVSYQLNKQKDYQPLWDAFDALGAFKVMRDFYLVDTANAADELRGYLAQHIDTDDYVFVAPLGSEPSKQGCWKGTQAWIDARF
ncbi:hypothetical protein FJ951_16345 [Mesorhizobium sp. B2-2-3]|uniref:hypothetical protein n=1 Tax=Mesorhizobium sp. B2-2-3 TaxID=2589963 RepID=UPI00112800BB|nr:hypothetical protein [Mesorhizobium sp. B2-2-3]TPM45415.1 hypothetical protein FJ951_16345 [Mesorhizobium sp. B2-2-3]